MNRSSSFGSKHPKRLSLHVERCDEQSPGNTTNGGTNALNAPLQRSRKPASAAALHCLPIGLRGEIPRPLTRTFLRRLETLHRRERLDRVVVSIVRSLRHQHVRGRHWPSRWGCRAARKSQPFETIRVCATARSHRPSRKFRRCAQSAVRCRRTRLREVHPPCRATGLVSGPCSTATMHGRLMTTCAALSGS